MNTPLSENHRDEEPILERNIARLVASVGRLPPETKESVSPEVLTEVGLQRRRLVRRRAVAVALTALVATAAALLVVVVAELSRRPRQAARSIVEVAQVTAVSGIASLTNGGTPLALAGQEGVPAGHWLETAWGSQAEVLLADQSTLVVQPHTRLQINSSNGGKEILLEQGQISVEVAKQPPGNVLTIRTPESKVTVVGTALDVRVLTKPDGRKQTWVDVHSGRVEFASGGQSVLLQPNMQGIANEGEPPIARSQTSRSERAEAACGPTPRPGC